MAAGRPCWMEKGWNDVFCPPSTRGVAAGRGDRVIRAAFESLRQQGILSLPSFRRGAGEVMISAGSAAPQRGMTCRGCPIQYAEPRFPTPEGRFANRPAYQEIPAGEGACATIRTQPQNRFANLKAGTGKTPRSMYFLARLGRAKIHRLFKNTCHCHNSLSRHSLFQLIMGKNGHT
jgi:hypothetical protein